MRLESERLVLRPWREEDEPSLVRHANNRKVSINLRDHFPYPYTLEDARAWIGRCKSSPPPPQAFAIEHGGEAIGGIGLLPMADVARFTAEVGYWLGEAHWGQGFAAEALRRLTAYAFERLSYERLEAWVFSSNPNSCKVLEKAGYEYEATLRRAAFKEGRFLDCHVYMRLRGR
jgi:RimJ/RimL family protein N-acetyltransferase